MKKKTLIEFKNDIRKYKLSLNLADSKLATVYSYANGCGAKDGINVPDTIYGIDISSACHIHDIKWVLATCYTDLLIANSEFTQDLKNICDKESNWFTGYFRRLRIATYSYSVDEWGTKAYAVERGFIDVQM